LVQFVDKINRKVEERAEVVRELKKEIIAAFSNGETPTSSILGCCPDEPLNLTSDPRYANRVRFLLYPAKSEER